MKFGLLSADGETLALAQAATAAGHVVMRRWEDDPGAVTTSWEELFDPAEADAVVIGGCGEDADRRARQIQELAKLARPVLAAHPVVTSVISYFEIDLARGESGAVLRHFNPLVETPLVERLAAWVDGGHPEFGAVEQISATRFASDRSRDRVMWHFARDVDLLARLAGRFDRIGAHAGYGDGEAAYASLGIQLLGRRPLPVRWAVEPASGPESLRVTLVCQRGRATLAFDSADAAVELIEHGPEGETRTAAAGPAPAARAIAAFAEAAATNDAAGSTWSAALDAMELADSIEISLRRGRMIDVHHRELTEQLAFKGVMSAVGCGVLAALVPVVIVAGWIAGALNIPLADYWPHMLLALLAGFLALQVLPRLLMRRPTAAATGNGVRQSPSPGSKETESDSAD